MLETDFLIAGAGIMGLTIARELARTYPDSRILLVEKEKELAFHASGRNSGVLHAGFYYDADSLKARYTKAGNRLLTDYCLEHGLPINRCGKVVVAAAPEEVEGIYELKRRGERNAIDLRLIDPHELAQLEPNARTVEAALFSPTTSTVNPRAVCRDIAARLPRSVRLLFEQPLLSVTGGTARTPRESIRFRYLFNAAGLYADRLARQCGTGRDYMVLPFKGLYLACRDDHLIQRHIYPVPNLKNPFLGVHFTKTVDGHVKIGPTAVPAFWLENYDFRHRFKADEFVTIVGAQARLFAANRFNFRSLVREELRKYHRPYFIDAARRLVRHLDAERFGGYLTPGIRAQLLHKARGELVMDFVVERGERSTHVLNSVSPAFTTSFAFAADIVAGARKHVDASA